MRRVLTLIFLAALAAGCREGFPSLNDAPRGAPPDLVAARNTASADVERLKQARDAAARPPPAPAALSSRPARLLAALSASDALPPGVVERAIADARSTGRSLELIGVGVGGAAAAERFAAAFRARGAKPRVTAFAGQPDAPGRVEVYLAP